MGASFGDSLHWLAAKESCDGDNISVETLISDLRSSGESSAEIAEAAPHP